MEFETHSSGICTTYEPKNSHSLAADNSIEGRVRIVLKWPPLSVKFCLLYCFCTVWKAWPNTTRKEFLGLKQRWPSSVKWRTWWPNENLVAWPCKLENLNLWLKLKIWWPGLVNWRTWSVWLKLKIWWPGLVNWRTWSVLLTGWLRNKVVNFVDFVDWHSK